MLRKTGLLLLALLSKSGFADERLSAIVAGTDVTPALSGLQVSLMRDGRATESFAYGFAQLSPDGKEPLAREHKLRIASISKLVVAVGVMRLVEGGSLDLDADVSRYLGWPLRNPEYPDSPITARQLLSHTSSIRDGSAYFIAAGAGQLRDFFTPESSLWESGAHFAPNLSADASRKPGHYFYYSNLNFGVLATIIEMLSQQRFDLYMQEQVLDPLGLSARFNPCEINPEQRAAAFRKRSGESNWDPDGPWIAQVDGGAPRCFYGMQGADSFGVQGADSYGVQGADSAKAFLAGYELGSNATLFSPQGGLRASADDLIVVLRMLAAGGEVNGRQILSPESVTEMLAPVWSLDDRGSNGLSAGEAEPGGPTDGLMTSYGLSVHRIDLCACGFCDNTTEGSKLLLGHLGEAYGVLSMALFDPKTGDGLSSIVTGVASDPGHSPGHSPLYRVEEELLRWWLDR